MSHFFDRFFKDVGIDLGTANTLIYVKNRGLAINEPSVAAVNNKTNLVLAVGEDAKKMLGRTPSHITVVRPLVNGVISDFEMTREMLHQFLRRLSAKIAPLTSYRRGILAIPNNLTEVERKSVEDAALSAGCAKVYLIEQPMASGIGAGLPIRDPEGSMIVDIGGGTTEVALLSLAGIVTSKSVRVGGDAFDEAISNYMKNAHGLAVGSNSAERIKIKIGSAAPLPEELKMEIGGLDLSTGLPKKVLIHSEEIRDALKDPVSHIVMAIKKTLEESPPELAADLVERGIMMAGGSSQLKQLQRLVEISTGLPVKLAEDPLTCVARGTGVVLEQLDLLKAILDTGKEE